MKIGILTFHNAHNYGAVLQAYALREKLRTMGHDAQIINYCNEKVTAAYPKVLKPVFCKRDVLPTHWKANVLKIVNAFYGQKHWQEQWEAFDKFIREVILEGNTKVVTKEELATLDIDMFVLGSDQIWESYITGGLDSAYLGDFGTKAKVISYAASLHGGRIPEQEKDVFVEKFKNFYRISTREEKLAEHVRELTGREVVTVVDPTLLLQAENYSALVDKQVETPKERYAFAYFVMEDPALSACVERIKKEQNMKVIELHYYRTVEFGGEDQFANMGPAEFLTFIKNAEFVVTNSFHGTVFSLLYHKLFYAVYKKNSRIENLLTFIKKKERHIEDEKGLDLTATIDYSEVDGLLQSYREQSVKYLEEALS